MLAGVGLALLAWLRPGLPRDARSRVALMFAYPRYQVARGEGELSPCRRHVSGLRIMLCVPRADRAGVRGSFWCYRTRADATHSCSARWGHFVNTLSPLGV